MKVYKLVFAKKISPVSQFVEEGVTESNFSFDLKRLFVQYEKAISEYHYKVVAFNISYSQMDKIFNLIAVDNILQPNNKKYLHLSDSFKKPKTKSVKEAVESVYEIVECEEEGNLPF